MQVGVNGLNQEEKEILLILPIALVIFLMVDLMALVQNKLKLP